MGKTDTKDALSSYLSSLHELKSPKKCSYKGINTEAGESIKQIIMKV